MLRCAALLMGLLERLGHDARYAARSLRCRPRFSLTVIAVLAIGIGANTAIFSVAKDVLFRPLPYPAPDRLVQYISRTQTGTAALASVPKYTAWRESLRIHESITAYHGGGPGVTLVQGDRRQHLAAMYVSASYVTVFRAPILSLQHMVAGDSRPALQLLSGAVFLVLLIACANAANLFVARSARRKVDITTRAALGAGRSRIAGQLLVECLLLSLVGGGLGLALATVGIRALLAAIPGGLAGTVDVRLDAQLLGFTCSVSVFSAVVFGSLPALSASRVDLSVALRDSGAEMAGGVRQHRRQSLLAVLELTLAIVLLVGRR